jgi:dienelactone hydrolase
MCCGDAYAALVYLRSRPDIDPGRIGLLGWSRGAGTTLDAMTRRPPALDGYAAAVAFHPGCRTRAKRADRFHPYAPLLVLIGASDDWTPAAPCETLAGEVAARGEPMRIVVYPGAYHDFDNPGLRSKRVRTEVPNGTRPRRGRDARAGRGRARRCDGPRAGLLRETPARGRDARRRHAIAEAVAAGGAGRARIHAPFRA